MKHFACCYSHIYNLQYGTGSYSECHLDICQENFKTKGEKDEKKHHKRSKQTGCHGTTVFDGCISSGKGATHSVCVHWLCCAQRSFFLSLQLSSSNVSFSQAKTERMLKGHEKFIQVRLLGLMQSWKADWGRSSIIIPIKGRDFLCIYIPTGSLTKLAPIILVFSYNDFFFKLHRKFVFLSH